MKHKTSSIFRINLGISILLFAISTTNFAEAKKPELNCCTLSKTEPCLVSIVDSSCLKQLSCSNFSNGNPINWPNTELFSDVTFCSFFAHCHENVAAFVGLILSMLPCEVPEEFEMNDQDWLQVHTSEFDPQNRTIRVEFRNIGKRPGRIWDFRFSESYNSIFLIARDTNIGGLALFPRKRKGFVRDNPRIIEILPEKSVFLDLVLTNENWEGFGTDPEIFNKLESVRLVVHVAATENANEYRVTPGTFDSNWIELRQE